jgi:hypothetical protein
MNIENIIIGHIYKNWNAVCECLEIPNTRGDTKQAYKKELDRYFIYHQEGNKFIFDEKYDIPLDKADRRINNGGSHNNKYNNLLDKLIIKALLENSNHIEASFSKMFFEYIPLFTNKYRSFTLNDYEKLADEYNTTKALINLYYSKMRNKVKSSFETALNRLQRDSIIKWEETYVIKMGRKKDIISSSDDLFNQIKEIEKIISQQLNKDMYAIWGNKEYKDILLAEVEDKLKITNYWRQYSISLLKHIEKPMVNINELKSKYILSIHKGLLNKPCRNDYNEKYYPYKAKFHKKAILKLDEILWQGDKIVDNENYEFQSMNNEKLFGITPANEDSDENYEFPY